MWERLSKHFVLFCICLVILFLFIFPYCIIRIGNSLTVNRYLKREFYLLNNEINIKYVGNNAHANIKGIHGDRHRWWISAYECTVPFMDKTFEIWIDKRNYTIFGTDFYEVLLYDKKFQHLYSEWVKNQVGIEDENVELEFKGALKGARWVGDEPYIDFSKITSLDNLIEDICKNTHNLYLYSIDKKISNRETKDDWLQTSKMLRDEYVDKIKDFNLSLIWDNEVSVKLYYYDVDLVNDRYNHIGLKKDNTNFYYILFNLQNNDIKYLCNYYDCTGASVLQSWLKEIDD